MGALEGGGGVNRRNVNTSDNTVPTLIDSYVQQSPRGTRIDLGSSLPPPNNNPLGRSPSTGTLQHTSASPELKVDMCTHVHTPAPSATTFSPYMHAHKHTHDFKFHFPPPNNHKRTNEKPSASTCSQELVTTTMTAK